MSGLITTLALAATATLPGNPDILVVVVDDLGVDQLTAMGWAPDDDHAAHMPILQQLCDQSLVFTQAWAMPGSSSSRAALLTGRYPMRTRLLATQNAGMVTPTQFNPGETTIAELLRDEGLSSGLFGDYHLGMNGPSGPAAPGTDSGFDVFQGHLHTPTVLDTTAGGQAVLGHEGGQPWGPFTCGAPADGISGACCLGSSICIEDTDPFECLALGGIPLVEEDDDGVWTTATTCTGECSKVDFEIPNAQYRWTMTESHRDQQDAEQSSETSYMLSRIAQQAASWVGTQGHDAWFCMVNLSGGNTPSHLPPGDLPYGDAPGLAGCIDQGDLLAANKQRLEAFDRTLGAMLLDMDLARYAWGTWDIELKPFNQTGTWIILVGDGGSPGATTQPPFDATRAGGTLYQGGVWVPMIVGGPQMATAGQTSDALVNIVDLFVLIAELTSVDLETALNLDQRPIDGLPMLDLLMNEEAEPARAFNHAEYGAGAWPRFHGGVCIIGDHCSDYLYASVVDCMAAGGIFHGPDEFTACCDYWDAVGAPAQATTQPMRAWSVRSRDHKLIMRLGASCPRETACELEFYRLSAPVPPNDPGLESDETRIEIPPSDAQDIEALAVLRAELQMVIESEPWCMGDANRDRRVDSHDLLGVLSTWGMNQMETGLDPAQSRGSFFDATHDGLVAVDDILAVIRNWTSDCTGQTPFPPTRATQVQWDGAWNINWVAEAPMDCLYGD